MLLLLVLVPVLCKRKPPLIPTFLSSFIAPEHLTERSSDLSLPKPYHSTTGMVENAPLQVDAAARL